MGRRRRRHSRRAASVAKRASGASLSPRGTLRAPGERWFARPLALFDIYGSIMSREPDVGFGKIGILCRVNVASAEIHSATRPVDVRLAHEAGYSLVLSRPNLPPSLNDRRHDRRRSSVAYKTSCTSRRCRRRRRLHLAVGAVNDDTNPRRHIESNESTAAV